jgi:AraC-like DNA-binding protein
MFPGLPFRYSVGRSRQWIETYIGFNGPIFDVWRDTKMLDPARPVWHLPTDQDWAQQLCTLAQTNGGGAIEPLLLISRLIGFLCAAHIAADVTQVLDSEPAWLHRARSLLEEDARGPSNLSEIAHAVGLSYDTFRRQFRRHTGIAPARYRMNRRMVAASDLLLNTSMSIRQIAEGLGFYNEFHFSQKFKQLKGVSPREFRRHSGRCIA